MTQQQESSLELIHTEQSRQPEHCSQAEPAQLLLTQPSELRPVSGRKIISVQYEQAGENKGLKLKITKQTKKPRSTKKAHDNRQRRLAWSKWKHSKQRILLPSVITLFSAELYLAIYYYTSKHLIDSLMGELI